MRFAVLGPVAILCWLVMVGFSGPDRPPQTRLGPKALGPQHVVLLTSIDVAHVRLPFYLFWRRSYYRKYEPRLEWAFRSYFESRGYTVDIQAESTQADLWKALHSPQNVAVFWLSHAAGAKSSTPGLESSGMIADVDGFDITPAFQQAHPNLRFLGVIGCRSEDALFKQLSAYHVLQDNPLLEVRAFNTKVDARQGLQKMMEVGAAKIAPYFVSGGYESSCPVRRGFALPIVRHAPAHAAFVPAARVERGGQVLGVFPVAKAGETQTMTVYLELPVGPVAPFELKLVEDAGRSLGVMATEVGLGDLELGVPWPGAQWKAFAGRDGRAIGVTSHIYKYTGAAITVTASPAEAEKAGPGNAAPEEFHPYECAAMPAL